MKVNEALVEVMTEATKGMGGFIGAMLSATGINLVVDPNVGMKSVQYRFPRSKKRRIQNKWRKNKANFRMVEVDEAYMIGQHTMVLGPRQYETLKYAVAKGKMLNVAKNAGFRVGVDW